MKYIVKVEVKVYEAEGEMEDIIDTSLKTTAPDKESAEVFGNALVDAITEKFRAPRKTVNDRQSAN